MSEIKNKTIEDKLKAATMNDAVMQDFLLAVVGNEYKTIQYSRVYNNELDKALKMLEGEVNGV